MFRTCAIAAVLFGIPAFAASTATPVSFHKDVEPILQKHCQGCHRPGEIGPFSLLSYNEARPWAMDTSRTIAGSARPKSTP